MYGDQDQDKIMTINAVEGQNKLDFLLSHVDTVEKIYFAGGEPLFMDEQYTILDLLYQHKIFNVRIQYNTNMSTLEHKGKNVLDYWKKWAKDKVEIWPSIDEISDRAELIRKGTVWKQVEENLLVVKELGVYMAPGITVGAMNVFRLPEIIRHLISIGIITKEHNYKNFFINLLEYPKHYHVSILSDSFKEKITIDLQNFIKEMKSQYDVNLADSFSYFLQQLSLPHDAEAKKRFIDLTAKLDNLRNEDTYTVIPELQDVLKNV
jgi:sulfatase maturation enzyme AslB (radical SAM superfamily)